MPSADTDITLAAHHLTRRLGNREVIRDVSLQLKRGEVLGLLGHNGAGKSTTMQMLTGCLSPHGGNITICGIDLLREPVRAKAHIGYLPEHPPLYRELSVNDYLVYAARLRGLQSDAVPAALERARQRCGLNDAGKRIIGSLSKGYQQRLGIAQAIIHNPDVIVLDEPTVGLDPAQIVEVRNLIRELGNTRSVILSTHLLGEVENVCDRVEVLHHGAIVYSGTTTDLGARTGQFETNFIRLTEAQA